MSRVLGDVYKRQVQEDAEGERLVQVRSFRILDEFEEGGW